MIFCQLYITKRFSMKHTSPNTIFYYSDLLWLRLNSITGLRKNVYNI